MERNADKAFASGAQLATDDVVGQRYRIVELIGHGGQSWVYRAVDLRDGDEVALKVLKPNVRNTDPDAVERMFREAYAMATLQGTSALRVLDQAWAEGGSFCLVTELIRGVELGTWLDRVETAGERPSVEQVIELLEPIAFTLDAAHRQGIIHRDLKPSNIFVVDEASGGGVRLIDFGFAKFTRMRGFTQKHVIAGSPSYIAPEAWLNQRELFDQRLDVYALGALIFRCLAGKPPFEGTGSLLDLLRAVTQAPRPSLVALRPDLPAALDDWTMHALAIRPDERFQRVSALWNAFRTAAGA